MAVSVSDVKLKSAKPEAKPYRIPIGENVYVDVLPNGRKVWRMRYLKPPAKKPAITTERLPMIDRDGHKISVGRYSLSPEHQALAAKLLKNGS
jgi:hypothetical protein